MDELRDLYQTMILDHNRSPLNFGSLENPNRRAEGDNPICGDRLTLQLEVDVDGRVTNVRFHGKGCAISTASASLMTESVKGKTREEAEQLFAGFHELLTGDPSQVGEASAELGQLAVFAGVREFPVRVKCATLAWHTPKAALAGDGRATTE